MWMRTLLYKYLAQVDAMRPVSLVPCQIKLIQLAGFREGINQVQLLVDIIWTSS